MDGFKKIDLDNNCQPVKSEKMIVVKTKSHKKIFSFAFLFLLVFILLIGLAVRNVYGKAKTTFSKAREAYQAVKTQNLAEADLKIKETGRALAETKKAMAFLGWAKFIPFIGGYYNDASHVLSAGLAGIEAGEVAIEAITPYADLLGFKGGSSFVEKSTDERIKTAVQTLDKLSPELSRIAEKLSIVEKEIEGIDETRYPEKIGQISLRSKISLLKNEAGGLIKLFVEGQPLVKLAPALLGEPTPRRYLILFQNDKELRPTGGFLTAYAVFELKNGKMTVVRSDDIYKLDEAKTKKFGAPPEILKYHKGVYYFNLRDSNLSPDFVESMKKFEELYQTVSGKEDVDGIIAVDTHVLVEAMKILGPIPAYGTNFTVEPDKRCNGCPQVIYELERFADQPVNYERGSRKDIIGVLLYQIMEKALGVSPSQYWGRLFQMAVKEIEEKHILFYFHDEAAQKGVEALNFAGRIKDYDGDYLHINDTNFAGAKANMFVEEKVEEEIETKGADLVKTLTITYRNPYPPSDCGLESGGLCLNAPLRNWLRIYVPKGSELIDFKGSETEVVTKEDLGKTVFEGFLIVNPKGMAKVIVKYKLPSIPLKNEYRQLIQKQPGTEGHEYTVVLNGKEVEKFNLTTDREVKLKI